jgi:DHA1 family tetracycline resistance protein-like MFS transporter
MLLCASLEKLMPEKSQSRSLSPVFLIFLTVLIDMVGFGIVIPILPLYSEHFGASPWQIGLLLGSFSLMQLIFSPIMGRWSDRIGRKPVLLLSILGTSIGFLTLGLANSLWMLFLGRIIDGISGGNISTAQAYIADVTPLEKRSTAMGIIGAAFGLGFMLGPALGGLLGHDSLQTPFFWAAGLALLNSVLLYFFLPESLPEERRKAQVTETSALGSNLLSIAGTPLGTVLLCSLTCTVAFSLVTALFTLFTAHRLHWDARANGMLFAYIGFLGILVQGGLIRRLVPKFGEKPLVIFGALLLCLSMLILPVSDSLSVVILASSGLSIGHSLIVPMLNGLASKSADAQSQGSVMGLAQAISSLARMIGPALGGLLLNFDELHPNLPYGISPFWASAAIMLIGIAAAFRLASSHQPVHAQAQEAQ